MAALPADIRLLALDVDGVLSDGGIFVNDTGGEFKRFDVTDGLGLRAWQQLGFGTAIITGRTGDTVLHRAAQLRIPHVLLGSRDKASSLAELVTLSGVSAEHIAFIGDDWPDLPVLRRVGYPMAVGSAAPAVRKLASFVTTRPGGHGAVREAIEHLLHAKGLLGRAVALYDPQHVQ
ncbi:MAG: KdsC family phosphatase [Phycisphaerales bacterium]